MFSKLDEAEQRLRLTNKHFLESYHYINKDRPLDRIRGDGIRVFLDSGAFSAFSLGAVINLKDYCRYVHNNADIISFPSVLDAIGDHKGTWANQRDMELQDVTALPCYHFGEPHEVLEYYIERYSYVTIGGLVPISVKQKIIWLDRIWKKYLTNADGTAKLKIHGFGLTSLPLMRRYPWYSVDSSTWVQWSANGMILLPQSGIQINISNKSSARKIKGQHIDNVPQVQRQALEDEIWQSGVDPDRLRMLYYSRWAYNVWAFPEFLRLHGPATHFKVEQEGLF